jgi:hypothetical protein
MTVPAFLFFGGGVEAAVWNAFLAVSPVAAREPSADPIVSATAKSVASLFVFFMGIFLGGFCVDSSPLRRKMRAYL